LLLTKKNGRQQVLRLAQNDSQKNKCKCNDKCRSRFPEGMTERKASATAAANATAKANTGILHYVQDDGGLEGGGLASGWRGLEGGA
jgi:hypothetical protein